MSVENELKRRGGIARSRALIERGYTKYALSGAVRAGRVSRPQRGWLALPNADPALVFAARNGVLIACITQAKRRGLWVLDDRELHVAAPGSGAKIGDVHGIVHWCRPVAPRPPDALEETIENVLAQVAACQPYERALAVWESAMNKRIVDRRHLEQLPYRGAARKLLLESTPYSDSGLESLVFSRLKWMRVDIRQQIWLHGHRVDFLIGERLVLQVDGATHTGAQRTEDIRHDAELNRMGYRVIRVSYEQVLHRWHEVQEAVMGAIACGHHLARTHRVPEIGRQPDQNQRFRPADG